MKTAFEYIDRNIGRMTEELEVLCAFRSVEGDAAGLRGAREYLLGKMREVGLETLQIGDCEENTILCGQSLREGRETILFYNHYDVVPEGPMEEWNAPPFKMVVRDGRLWARGVSDNKGALMARLHALEAVRACCPQLPAGVKTLYDANEESGSRGMEKCLEERPEDFCRLTEADLCLWENGMHTADGRPQAAFGVRSTCVVDLSVTTSNCDEHARVGAEIPNAAWRLVWALSSIKDMEENILIDGFLDEVPAATAADREVLAQYPYDEAAFLERKGIKAFLGGLSGTQLKEKIFMSPSVTISALEAGRPHEGIRNIVPHTASARLIFLMVPHQTAEEVYRKVRRHLEKNGFGDIQASCASRGAPVRTPVDSKYRYMLERAATHVYDKPLIPSITQLGSGPAYLLRRANPGLPIVAACGVSSSLSGHHSPSENIFLQNYINGIKHTVAMLFEVGNQE